MAYSAPRPVAFSIPVGVVNHHARSCDYAPDQALIEAQGYDVIYGDTDSTFVWLRRAHSEADAAEIGHRLVRHVNEWWAQTLQQQI
ncbi:DNA polymerase II [Salmonella enterica subsp. enterica]|nr:DNA polymerase II [Salmonella enterica subsp. enterica]